MNTLFVKNTLPVAANFNFASSISTTINKIAGDSFNLQLALSSLPFNKSATVKKWTSTSLPAGLTLNSSSGIISGTFSALATDTTTNVSISITSNQFSGTITIPTQLVFNVKAYATPIITSETLPKQTNVALNFSPKYTGVITNWSASGLPSGLLINSTTGAITGTYTGSPASYAVTITGSNISASTSAIITLQFSATSISITNPIYYFNYGLYTEIFPTLSANADLISATAVLPQGLYVSVSNNILKIYGTAQNALGSYPVTISLTNINGTYTQQVTLNIINGVPVINNAQSVPVTYKSSINQQLFLSQPNYTPTLNPVSGYDPTVTWRINGADIINYTGLLGGLAITTGGLLTGTYNPTYAGAVAPKQFSLSVSAINFSGTGTANIPVNISTIAPNFKTTIPTFNSSIDTSVNILASDYIDDYPNIFKPITSFGTTYLLNGFVMNSTGCITGISNACTTSQVKIATIAINPGNGSTTIYQDISGNVSGGAPQIPSIQNSTSTVNNTLIYQLSGSVNTCRQVTGWETNSLINGITLSSGDGLVKISSSTPIGVYKANITGKNQFGSASTQLTITVNDYDANLKFYKGEVNRVVDSTSIIVGHPINTSACGRFLQRSNSNIFSDNVVYFADTPQTVSQVTSNTGNYLMTYYSQVNSSGCTGYSFTQPLYIYSELAKLNSQSINQITASYFKPFNQSTGNSIILDLDSGIRSVSGISFTSVTNPYYTKAIGLTYRTGDGKLYIYATGNGLMFTLNPVDVNANISIINPLGKTSKYSQDFSFLVSMDSITSVPSTGYVYFLDNSATTQSINLDTWSWASDDDLKPVAPASVIFDPNNTKFSSSYTTRYITDDGVTIKSVDLNINTNAPTGIYTLTGKYYNGDGSYISTNHTFVIWPKALAAPILDKSITINGYVNSPVSYQFTGQNIDANTTWTIADYNMPAISYGYIDSGKDLFFSRPSYYTPNKLAWGNNYPTIPNNILNGYTNNYAKITGIVATPKTSHKLLTVTNLFGTTQADVFFNINGYDPSIIPTINSGIYNLYSNSEYVLVSGSVGVILSSGGYYRGNTQAIAAVNGVKNNLSYYLSQNHVGGKYILPVTGGPTTGDALFTGNGIFAVYVIFGGDTSAFGPANFNINPGYLNSISGKMSSSIYEVSWQSEDTGIISKYGYFTGVAPTGATGNYLFEKVPVFSLSGFDNIKQNVYVTGFTGAFQSANGNYKLNIDVTGLDSQYTQAVWKKQPSTIYDTIYTSGKTVTGFSWSGENSSVYKNAYTAGYRLTGFINPSNTYFWDGKPSWADSNYSCGAYPCNSYVIYQTPEKNWVKLVEMNKSQDVVNSVAFYNAFTFSDYGIFRMNNSGTLATGTNNFSISGNSTNWRLLSGTSVRGSGSGSADLKWTYWKFLTSGGSLVDIDPNNGEYIFDLGYYNSINNSYVTNISTTGDILTGVSWYDSPTLNGASLINGNGKVLSQAIYETGVGTYSTTSPDGSKAAEHVITYDENRALGIYMQRYFLTNTEPVRRIAYDTGTQPKAYNKWPWEASGKWSYDANNAQYFSGYNGNINLIITGDNQSQTPVPDSAIYSGLKLADIPRFSMDNKGNIKLFMGQRFWQSSDRTPESLSLQLTKLNGDILKDELIFTYVNPDTIVTTGIKSSTTGDSVILSIRNFTK